MLQKIAVIGGGIAGLSVARDLSLRGFEVAIFDKQKIGNGTTNQCAGMLHSGARYATKDLRTARLCFQENKIVKKVLPHAVGKKKAFFIRYKTDDPEYEKKFVQGCKKIGIPIRKVSGKKARQIEPELSSEVTHVFETPDVVVDTYILVFSYFEDLKKRGVKIFESTEVVGASRTLDRWIIKTNNNKKYQFDLVINCTGDGLSSVTRVFGEKIDLSYIYGSMALFRGQLSSRIITRCASNAVGDVIVPVKKHTLIGSTWHERSKCSVIKISKKDEKEIKKTAANMLPTVSKSKLISSLTSVRTHLRDSSYSASFGSNRDFLIFEHERDGCKINLISVLPGKMTIARYVAEQVGNIVCNRFGIKNKSNTKNLPIENPSEIRRKFEFYID